VKREQAYTPSPCIFVTEDYGPTPTETVKGDGWELELWDGHLSIGDGYDGGFSIESERDYQAFLIGLRKLASKMGWSGSE
jgi:hypothetical protein